MIEFLKESNTFEGVTFSGKYDMPINHLEKIYRYYKETGENLLDCYSRLIYTSWNNNDGVLIDGSRYNEIMVSVSKIRRLKILETDFLYKVMKIADSQYERYREYNSRERVRVKANNYTSKPKIRNKVFELHGEVCLKCGSEDHIQLDHVVSVRRGGKNKIDNLQPLCKDCNIKKGTKIKDYRNGL